MFLFLVFGLLLIPFLLLRIVFKFLVFLVALPFVLLMIGGGLLLAFLAVVCVLLIPLMPIAFLAFCIWAIVRAASRPSLSY